MNVKTAKKIIEKWRLSTVRPREEAQAKGYLKGYADALRGEEIEALVSAFTELTTQTWTNEMWDRARTALKAFRAARGEKE